MRFLAMMMTAALVFAADDALVTKVPAELDAKVLTLSKGAPRNADKFVFKDVPASLEKAVLVIVKRGEGSKPGSGYSITVSKNAVVYLFVQERGKPVLSAEWKLTALKAAWSPDGSQGFSDMIYQRDVAPGVVDIPAHDGAEGTFFGIPNVCVIVPKN